MAGPRRGHRALFVEGAAASGASSIVEASGGASTPTAAHGHSAADRPGGGTSAPAAGTPRTLLDRLLAADGFDFIVIAEAPR